MMDAIFGREKGAEPELFSLRNGIIMDTVNWSLCGLVLVKKADITYSIQQIVETDQVESK